MSDTTPVIGMIGTGLSFTLGQWNDLVGLCAGILTCVYLVWKLLKLKKMSENKKSKKSTCEGCTTPNVCKVVGCVAKAGEDKKDDPKPELNLTNQKENNFPNRLLL